DKHCRAANEAKKERDEKNAENTAVENRAENVDRLDKVLDQVGQERERNGDTAPRSGEQFRDEKIMIVARMGMQERSVKIHHRGRTERVQFRGAGGHPGAENDCDEQPDDAVRKIAKDKSDEDIIGVIGFELWVGVF